MSHGLKVIRIDFKEKYELTITPGADRVLVRPDSQALFPDRVSVPRFSDFIVRNQDFDKFLLQFNEKTLPKADNG